MGLFPVAPRISVRTPSVIYAGQTIETLIEIDAPADVRLDWIDARLETTESWTDGSGDGSTSRSDRHLALQARLFEGGVLRAGQQAHRVRFDLPAWLPPSLAIGSARVATLLKVEASIPWWPDKRATFEIPVRSAPRTFAHAPYRATNQASGGATPRVEISLASRSVPARGVLAGAVAFFHHDPRVTEGVHLALHAVTRLLVRGGSEHRRGVNAYDIALPRGVPVDGTPVPFKARLPDDLAPGFASSAMALEWQLRVEKPGVLGTSTLLAVPLSVIEPGGDATEDALVVPPIGDARLAQALADVARELGLGAEDDALIGSSGGVGFRIRRAVSAAHGTSLAAELALPRLGLALSVERTRFLPQLLQGDLAVGHDALDVAHRIDARDRDQARPFLADLAELLADGSLVRLDDDRLELEQRDVGLDPETLIAFATRVRELATAVDEAIAGIVPPSVIDADLEAWADVARALGGRFVAGDLSVVGHAGESEIAIETDLEAREHVIRVRPSPAIPEDVELRIAAPRDEGKTHGAALAGLLVAMPEGARELVISGGRATVRIPCAALADRRSRSEPRAAMRAASLLTRLGQALAPARGPFR